MPLPESDKVNTLYMNTTSGGEHTAATTCSPCLSAELQQQQQQNDSLLCQLHEELSEDRKKHLPHKVLLGASHNYGTIDKFSPNSLSRMA